MTQRERPIGIFDSGIGGLTVVRAVHRVLPQENIVYLGDTARVPYGTKSPSTVIRFACEDTQFLLEQGVKVIVVACNTASAWALPALEKQFDLPVLGVITPGVDLALKRSRTKRIGVIATPATIRSRAYANGLASRCAAAQVFAQACPLLVPLVEEGWIRHAVTRAVLREYLRPLQRARIDTLILGCTHYPLLKPVIRRLLGRRIALVDSAQSCGQTVSEHLARHNLLSRRRGDGAIQPFLTDETCQFAAMAKRFLGFPSQPAQRAELRGICSSR